MPVRTRPDPGFPWNRKTETPVLPCSAPTKLVRTTNKGQISLDARETSLVTSARILMTLATVWLSNTNECNGEFANSYEDDLAVVFELDSYIRRVSGESPPDG